MNRSKNSFLSVLILGSVWLLLSTGRPTRAAPLVQSGTECVNLFQEGVNLYEESKYSESLQKLQIALDCFRQAGPYRKQEGLVLYLMGAAYYGVGEYDQAVSASQESLAIQREVDDIEQQGGTLVLLGQANGQLKQYDDALTAYQQALFVYRQTGDREQEAVVLSEIGRVHEEQDNYEQAVETYQQAVAIHRELGEQSGEDSGLFYIFKRLDEAAILQKIANLYKDQRRYEAALDYFQQMLAIYRELEQESAQGSSLNDIGLAYENLGRFEEALASFEQALTFFQGGEDQQNEAVVLNNIGRVNQDLERYQEALISYQSALTLRRQMGDRAEEGATLHNIGVVYEAQGRTAEALEAYQQALTIYREVDNRAEEATILNNIGAIYGAQGRTAEALEAYQQALTIRREVGNRAVEAGILNNIGAVYWAQSRYTEALEVYQQALAIYREVDDQAREGTTLNNIGAVYKAQGRYAEALNYYQQHLAIVQATDDRAGEGTTLNNIGAVYEAQGRYAEALENFQAALPIRREVGNRVEEAGTLNNLGAVYKAQGRYAEAFDSFQAALTIFREMDVRTGEGMILNNIGAVYQAQGRYAEALDYYQQDLAITREVGDRAGEGDSLNNIGAIYEAQGRYAEALDSLQAALAIRREVGDRAGEGDSLNNIGAIYEAQGRYAEALDYYQRDLAITREVGDQAGEGGTLHNFGRVYEAQGRYAEALDSFQAALAIHREVGNRPMEGTTLDSIGAVYQAQGHYTEALDSLRAALTIAREVGDRAGEGETLHNIGEVHQAQGRTAEALESYQQALAIRREVGDRAGEGETLHNIGRVYEAQGRYIEAQDSYEQAIEILESLRAIAGSEQSRVSFIAQFASVYNDYITLLHQQGQYEEAFLVSERGRARAFLDSLATGQVQLSDNDAAELLAQEQEVYAQRRALQDNLAQARAQTSPDTDLIARLESQLAEVEAAYTDVQTQIQGRSDQLAELVPGRSQNVLDVAEVQAHLDDQITLVSYFVLEQETLVFLITRDNFQTFALNVSQAELEKTIHDFRDFATLDEAHPESAIKLYNWLIEPLKEKLTTPHLAIIPHNVLHYLPFAALTDGEQYLLDDFVLNTLPSASALPFILENTGRPLANPLIIGAPATDVDGLSLLLAAKQEAKAVAALFKASPLLDEAGTEQVVWEQGVEAGILHLAAHGQFNAANSLYSTLYLAPSDDGQDTSNDGRLEVHEIYGLKLNQADLVVLSACETQLGALSAGDEVVGLNRAFFFAGTPSVIASLWNVEDRATSLLMERFYTHLKDGTGKAEALRQAQLEVREQFPNPYYWSAFVLSGDAGEISLMPAPRQVTDQEEASPPLETEPTSSADETEELIAEIEKDDISSEADTEIEQSTSTMLLWAWLIGGTGCLGALIIGLLIWRRGRNP